MANKDLFKQAIADAKSVREAAIANAKETLEETLTPHLKDMLAAKLQEMEDAQVEEVVNEDLTEEEVEITEEETLAEAATEETKEEETLEEGDGLEAVKLEGEHGDEDVEEGEHEDVAEDDSEESEDEAEETEDEEEEVQDDEELTDLSVEDFKDLIRDIIAQEMGAGEAEVEDELGDDLDAGEEVPGEEGEELPADVPAEEEEEINLDELLAELEAETAEEVVAEEEVKEEEEEVKEETTEEVNEELTGEAHCMAKKEEVEKELAEAIETINTMKSELNETNLLNAKLLYVNKIFKANNLTESQKVNVIASFDKAETIKEVKLVHETVSETFTTKTAKKAIKEHRGSASQATASTAKPEVISEVSDAVRRMQKLAGII